MSKAFTKEQDNDTEGAEPAEGSALLLPKGAKNYMTPAGAASLREEMRALTDEKRPHDKRAQRDLDRRLRFLKARLETLEVVDPATQNHARVAFGASVTVRDEEGRERDYRIVGIDEADPQAGLISWISPIAQALLNSKVGDAITLRTPKGEEELEIAAICYS